jgi:uncharacterized protein YceK
MYLNTICFIGGRKMKQININILIVIIFILLTGCSSQTTVTDEVAFVGQGKYWNAKYVYNAKLYDEKHINWVEIALKEDEQSDFDINDIGIEFKSRDGSITGNVGDMETMIDKNTISFLVGTVNLETYKEDEYELTIKFKEKQDVVKLKVID